MVEEGAAAYSSLLFLAAASPFQHEALGILFESGGGSWWSRLAQWLCYFNDSPLCYAQRMSFARVALGPASPLAGG